MFLVYVCFGVFSYLGKKNSGFVQNGQFFYSVSSKIAHIERGVINLGMKIRKKKCHVTYKTTTKKDPYCVSFARRVFRVSCVCLWGLFAL